jgi:hypothetical protein
MHLERNVIFDGAGFMKRARFAGTDISGSTRFSDCMFIADADFSAGPGQDREARSFQDVSFHGSQFAGKVSFKNRIFTSTANFGGCAFFLAPDFHGAELHQDTRFPTMSAFQDRATEDAAAAYRTLRQAMDKNNARREEAMFYALEQKTLRSIPGAQTRWENFASYFYDKVSSYGVNFWKPLGLLFLIVSCFGVGYATWASWPIAVPSPVNFSRLGSGLTFSLQQVVNPFWVWRAADSPWETQWPDIVKVVATIQSLITTGLFALFILALRWRFKRD